MKSNLKIGITTGDPDGIGLEIAEKALQILGPQKGVDFLLWRSPHSYPKSLSRLKTLFQIVSLTSSEEALAFFLSDKMRSSILVEVVSTDSPALWVQTTAEWCFNKSLDGMVTGPLSKTEIFRAGLKDLGHTDILKRISNVKNVHMGFLGKEFNVVLTTAHIPLSQVSASLSVKALLTGLQSANLLRLGLPPSLQKKPIALVGVNPHAGEEGLIGDEERNFFAAVKAEAARQKIPTEGALVPDAAFLKPNWKKYSVYLAMYHDQGLIPFKLVHGQESGVHVSIGLPFVRTSVDHGTAKDLFGKGKALPFSMRDAIQACIRMARSSINK
jgi:4-hydroxythreonine-4-phosphate dehydrogenase